jgi:peroxiredoxin
MRPRPSPRAVLALAILAAFTGWITWRAKSIELGTGGPRNRYAPSPLVGKPAPDFKLELLDGRKVSRADYSGKTLVVTFWASWCDPCRMELPALAKFYLKTHKPDSDFEILAISIDDTKAAAAGTAASFKLPFPVALDLDSRVATAYGADSIPMMFVIGKDGKVARSTLGYDMTLDIMLAQFLDIKDYTPTMGGSK